MSTTKSKIDVLERRLSRYERHATLGDARPGDVLVGIGHGAVTYRFALVPSAENHGSTLLLIFEDGTVWPTRMEYSAHIAVASAGETP